MAASLRRFAAAYRMEFRLLCLHWSYPLLHLLWILFLYFMFRDRLSGTAGSSLFLEAGRFSIGLVSLIALFVAGASASRSHANRFADLEGALPAGPEVAVGRWLAGLTGLMGAMIEPLVMAYYLGPAGSFWAALPDFLLEALIALAFTTAVGWWLVERLQYKRWVYLMLVAGWLFFMVTPRLMANQGEDLPGLFLLDFMRQGRVDFTDAWGFVPEGATRLWFGLFYAGLTLLFICLTVGYARRSRFHRRSPAVALVSLAAVGLAAYSGTSYVRLVQGWSATWREDLARGQRYEESRQAKENQETSPAVTEVVEAYDLRLDLRNGGKPKYEASLTLRNRWTEPLSTLKLSLNPSLEITSASLPYRRHESLITLEPPQPLAPGESVEIRLAYEGPIWMVQDLRMAYPVVFFTRGDGVRLSTGAGWYPVTVDHPITVPFSTGLTHPPARMKLTVQAPKGMTLASNLTPTGPGEFAAESASWASLLASPRLVSESTDGLRLLVDRPSLPQARATAQAFKGVLDELGPFFPDLTVAGLQLDLLDDRTGMPASPPATDGWISLRVSRHDIELMARMGLQDGLSRFYQGRLFEALWNMTGDSPPYGELRDSLEAFILLRLNLKGDRAAIERTFDDSGDYGQKRFMPHLRQLYARQGDAGLIRVVRALRSGQTLPHEATEAQIAAWFREVSGVED